MNVFDRLQEAMSRYCANCKHHKRCHTPCALVQSFMMDLPCTPELERLSGYREEEQ